MGFFSKHKLKLNDKEKRKAVTKMKEGWKTNVKLPEVESVGHGMVTKGVATAAFGIIGLAMTMGSSNKPRKIFTKVRVAEKGVVIEQGTTDGKDLKIPWNSIINSHKESINIIALNLVDGGLITFNIYFSLKQERSAEFIIDYINERACGQTEEGW
jgi:hypothetical protein